VCWILVGWYPHSVSYGAYRLIGDIVYFLFLFVIDLYILFIYLDYITRRS